MKITDIISDERFLNAQEFLVRIAINLAVKVDALEKRCEALFNLADREAAVLDVLVEHAELKNEASFKMIRFTPIFEEDPGFEKVEKFFKLREEENEEEN